MKKNFNKNYRAMVFDLDGTILYTLKDIQKSLNRALQTHGRPAMGLDEVRSRVGHGLKRLVEEALPPEERAKRADDIYRELAKQYRSDPVGESQPYPGIMRCLEQLKAAGIPMAVLSNKDEDLVQVICTKLFSGFFKVLAGKPIDPSDPRKPKPHPGSLLHIAEQLKTPMEQILYLGDSEVDQQTAANAGCDFCGVSWGYRDRQVLEQLEVKIIVDNPSQLADLLPGH